MYPIVVWDRIIVKLLSINIILVNIQFIRDLTL